MSSAELAQRVVKVIHDMPMDMFFLLLLLSKYFNFHTTRVAKVKLVLLFRNSDMCNVITYFYCGKLNNFICKVARKSQIKVS